MRIMKGHYRTESGVLEIGTLGVEQTDGVWHLCYPSPCDPIKAERITVCQGITAIEITGAGAWEFLPDKGECERIGMPISETSTAVASG